MKLTLELDRNGHLIARQTQAGLTRYLIGVPVLGFGLLLLYGVFSSATITLTQSGTAGIGNAIAGSLVLLLFTALTLPLGWWLVFSRHWVTVDTTMLDVVQTSDWRLGKKEKRTPLSDFRAVRLATEELSVSTSSQKRTRATYIQMIRLLAVKPVDQLSIEIGWLEESDRERALELATEVSLTAKLPLEVLPVDQIAKTPAEEEMDKEDEEMEEDEA